MPRCRSSSPLARPINGRRPSRTVRRSSGPTSSIRCSRSCGDVRPSEVERAVDVNARLPHLLGELARGADARILQIATDCVYSGSRGEYVESDPHDALDVYGKTKSLGESFQETVHHLRCSIIG